MMTDDARCTPEIESRIATAIGAFNKFLSDYYTLKFNSLKSLV
jgi:hypothetical protein